MVCFLLPKSLSSLKYSWCHESCVHIYVSEQELHRCAWVWVIKKAIFSPNITMNTSEHERLQGKKSLETVTHPFTLYSTQMLSRHNDGLDDYLNYFLDCRCTNVLSQSPKAKYKKLFWKERRMHKSLLKGSKTWHKNKKI